MVPDICYQGPLSTHPPQRPVLTRSRGAMEAQTLTNT